MTKDEALKMCLEYIETNAHERRCVRWAIKDALAQPAQEPQVCCGEYDTCLRACTPRGRYLAQPEQEPVLWMMPDGNTADKWALQFYGGQKGKPLYTTPPQRTWVGLTGQEKALIASVSLDVHDAVHRTEAKLKERNT